MAEVFYVHPTAFNFWRSGTSSIPGPFTIAWETARCYWMTDEEKSYMNFTTASVTFMRLIVFMTVLTTLETTLRAMKPRVSGELNVMARNLSKAHLQSLIRGMVADSVRMVLWTVVCIAVFSTA